MSTESRPPVCIGLSFGNANSSIAHVTNEGKIEVIANQDGDRQIPSILSYVNDGELSGIQAKAQLIRNPSNTVSNFHDFIGKDFKNIDPTHCHASAHPVLDGDSIAFSIREKSGEDAKLVSLDTIVARHLTTLKQSASDYLGEEVTHVVMTIPTNFNETQQAVLRKEAATAGLTVMQFITEPIASLLASDQLRTDDTASLPDKFVVVADYGHTRSDIAVVASRGGIYTVLATLHNYEVSGFSLDKVIIDIASKEFLKRNPGATDPRTNTRALAKLQSQCDATKKALSVRQSAAFSVESLVDGLDFAMNIDRNTFELGGRRQFAALVGLVDKCVEKAGLKEADISEVLLTGSTSHIPRICEQLKATMPETVTVLDPAAPAGVVSPSEAAVRGAAIQASLIAEYDQQDIDESASVVVTAAPHTDAAIGIVFDNTENDRAANECDGITEFVPVILEHTPLPVRKTVVVDVPATTGGDVVIQLWEGKRFNRLRMVMPEQSGDDDDDDEMGKPEPIFDSVWQGTKEIAEAAVRGVKPGNKVELQILVSADFSIQVQAREAGSQGGVRGTVPFSEAK